MAYVTDYSTVVPYNTSVTITNTDVANSIADILAANFGFTLVSHATAGVASSASNYAKLTWQGSELRIYSTSTSDYGLRFQIFFDGTTSSVSTAITTTIPFITGISATVSLRKITYKGGFVCQVLLSTGTWTTILIQSIAQNISTEQTYYALSQFDTATNQVGVSVGDGNRVMQYYHTTVYPYDTSGTKQILTQIMAGPSSSNTVWTRTFILKYLYCAAVLTFQGIAEINGKTFYGSGVIAYEVA